MSRSGRWPVLVLTASLGGFSLLACEPIDDADGGFTFLVNNNFQLDVRAGVGLNEAADDYFVGTGFAVRR